MARPNLEYIVPVWQNIPKFLASKNESIYQRAMRIIYSKIFSQESGFKKFGIRVPDSKETCGRKPYRKENWIGFKDIRIHVDGA